MSRPFLNFRLPVSLFIITKSHYDFLENGEALTGSTGISKGEYTLVDGYKYLNLFIEYEQKSAQDFPVELGVIFAFDSLGTLGARHYINLDENVKSGASPQMINISGKKTWHGSPRNKSSYVIRMPIVGPYVNVFPFNRDKKERKISMKAYLTK